MQNGLVWEEQTENFCVSCRCQHISSLPHGFLAQEVKLLQSDLQFEHSRQAIQEVQSNSKTKLVPCSAGELIWASCLTVCKSSNRDEMGLVV